MGIRAAITPQIGLVTLCGLLLAAGLFEAWAPLPAVVAPARVVDQRAPAPALPMAFAPPPASAFDAINERPIFSSDRTPFAASAAAAANGGTVPPSLALIGIILDGKTSMALIRSAASPLETAYTLGDTIDGWQVAEIDADKIVLRSGAATDEIALATNKAARGASPGARNPQASSPWRPMPPLSEPAAPQGSRASATAAPQPPNQ